MTETPPSDGALSITGQGPGRLTGHQGRRRAAHVLLRTSPVPVNHGSALCQGLETMTCRVCTNFHGIPCLRVEELGQQ